MTRPHSPIPLSDSATYRKVSLRLIPLLFFCYMLAYLDRVNVGFAKLAMHDEPWFSDAVFATGAGIFFLGYFFFEVPGNILLHRLGARLWISRIMVSWGVISTLMIFSHTATSFYILRFLLGVAEAGFFPGIILYLTYWYPREYRARVIALFMTAIAAAGIFGSPLSGWILNVTGGQFGLHSWQWLFILEGLPSIILGLLLPFLLTNGPAQAQWLLPAEKSLLLARLQAEQLRKVSEGANAFSFRDTFRSPQVWLLCALYFTLITGLYAASFWLPQIIQDNLSRDSWQIGLYSAVPWTSAAIAMVIVGHHSDRTGQRRFPIGISSLVAGACFGLSALPILPGWLKLLLLSLAVSGVLSSLACFWAVPTALLSGTAAAAGIAWINSVGNLAGYLSPEWIGWLKIHHGMGTALLVLGCVQSLAGLLTLLLLPAKPS